MFFFFSNRLGCRRLSGQPNDPRTKERIDALIIDIEGQIEVVRLRDEGKLQ
jgi:hypothetical protein